jgi:hypothetical protein
MLGTSNMAGLLDQVLIGTQGHVFHTFTVYTISVYF